MLKSLKYGAAAISALILLVAPAVAQTVYTAKKAASRPVISRDARGFDQCGIRVVVQDEKLGFTDAYDITLHIFPSQFAGAIEIGRLRITPEQMNAQALPKLQGLPPESFWIAQDTDNKPLAPTSLLKSSVPGKMVGQSPIVETRNVVVAIANGKRMQFAAEYAADKSAPRVIAFTAPLREEDRASFSACIDSLPARMQEEIDVEAKRNSDTLKQGNKPS